MPIVNLHAQVCITQCPETNKTTLEVPLNGGRKTIILNENAPETWGAIIKAELDAANAWQKKIFDREFEAKVAAANYKRELAEKKAEEYWPRHHRIWDTAASRPNQGKEFAEEKFGGRNRNSKKKIKISDLLAL
jgi:hypothetical protein